jgi:adenosylhomocysteine nucleosidase
MRIDTIAHRSVLFVMAAPQELTPALAARLDPLMTGIGPVEAAIALTATLTTLDPKPDLIVALGSAGSRVLEHARVYQIESVRYRDMDCSPLGFPRGITPLGDFPAILPLGPHIPGIPTATLSSGAGIVHGDAYDDLGAQMADMETFSFTRAAMRFGLPLIALRGVSDGKAPLTGQLTDWSHALEEIGDNLCAALHELEATLTSGAFPLRR